MSRPAAIHPRTHRDAATRAATNADPVFTGLTWLLRAVLLAAASYALLRGTREMAIGALVYLVLSLLPLALAPATGYRLPRRLEMVLVLGLAAIGASIGLGLYDTVWQWGKLIHAITGACAAYVGTELLVSYAHAKGWEVPTHVLALLGICLGITFGVFWQFVAFGVDWVRFSALQKSNADTMTDMLWNDLAAVCGMLLALRSLSHTRSEAEMTRAGGVAAWLFDPLGRVLDRHGRWAILLMVLLIAGYVAALWYSGRPVLGLRVD